MFKILKQMQSGIVWTLPLMMLAGFVSGYFFDLSALKIMIIPLTILMIYPIIVPVDPSSLFKKINWLVLLTAFGINFVLIPALALMIGNLFFPGNLTVITGLLLTGLLPTSGMTISWTHMSKGNVPEAIRMTLIGLLAGSFAVPFYLKFFTGSSVAPDIGTAVTQIALIIILPLILGLITRMLIIRFTGKEKFNSQIKEKFPLISTLGVFGIVFIAISLKARTLAQEPVMLLYSLLPLLMLYVINFTISTAIAKLFFKREDGLALVFGTVLRNLSIALAMAMNLFGQNGTDIALIIALAYMIQVQMAAWYIRFHDRIPSLRKSSDAKVETNS